MIFTDGSLYEGYWLFNKFQGKGYLIKPSGYSCFGTFENSKPCGVCTETYADGSVFKGKLGFGRKHGRGTLENKSKNYHYRGDWSYGKKVGTGKEIKDNVTYSG